VAFVKSQAADRYAVVFSPHLDDAVLSASVRLMSRAARVVTVFAGPPPDRIELTEWDRLTGARSSRERHLERLAEDQEAMALLGCASRRLDEPEAEYREGDLDFARLTALLRPLLVGAAEVWMPAAIGGHPDHIATRDAVLAALDGVRDHRVFLYADLPYAIWYGWPTWVSGEAAPEFLDPDRWLVDELVKGGLAPARLKADVVELTPRMRERKGAAVRSYRTQLPALTIAPNDGYRWPMFLRYEVAWQFRF